MREHPRPQWLVNRAGARACERRDYRLIDTGFPIRTRSVPSSRNSQCAGRHLTRIARPEAATKVEEGTDVRVSIREYFDEKGRIHSYSCKTLQHRVLRQLRKAHSPTSDGFDKRRFRKDLALAGESVGVPVWTVYVEI